jgi:hypothetical protein
MQANVIALPTRAMSSGDAAVMRLAMKCNGDSIAVKISIDNLDRDAIGIYRRLTPR